MNRTRTRTRNSLVLCLAANACHGAPESTEGYRQFVQNAGGILSIEAESYVGHDASATHAWTESAVGGASGTAMQTDDVGGGPVGFAAGPVLFYDIEISATGTRYAWVRGRASSSASDSLHVGIDGKAAVSPWYINAPYGVWAWKSVTIDEVAIGPHSLEIRMREDGYVIDKIVLTNDSAFDPSTVAGGLGPDETVAVPDFIQGGGPDGLLELEAEDATTLASAGGKSWVEVMSGTARQALPDTGVNVGYGTGPRMSFAVEITQTGTRWVWVRGRANAGNDDSLHVGVDGSPVASPWHFAGTKSELDWDRRTLDELALGHHVVDVWMREDGFAIDKLVFTSNPDYDPEAGGGDDGGAGSCDAQPGAGPGAPTLGPTTYADSGTTVVSNVIFDGNHSDDLVRVNNGHVIFDHVTFRGHGTGSSGHTLEIKVGGSAEVYDSIFEGDPSEDGIQTQLNQPTTIMCNVFATSPGEDHIDTKPGASVTVESNAFVADTPSGQTIQNHNGSGRVDLIDNTGMQRVFYEDGATGSIVGNDIGTSLWLYDVEDVLVEDNDIAFVKHGEGSSNRDPVDTYFLNNVIDDAQDSGGSCYRTGNTGSDPVPFCTAGAPGWYP